MVRGSHAPEWHSGKVHVLDDLVLESPIAKLDLRVEMKDLLILTESPASGQRGVYAWETGLEPASPFVRCAIIGGEWGAPAHPLPTQATLAMMRVRGMSAVQRCGVWMECGQRGVLQRSGRTRGWAHCPEQL